jgi:hypothetical protein
MQGCLHINVKISAPANFIMTVIAPKARKKNEKAIAQRFFNFAFQFLIFNTLIPLGGRFTPKSERI